MYGFPKKIFGTPCAVHQQRAIGYVSILRIDVLPCIDLSVWTGFAKMFNGKSPEVKDLWKVT